MKKSDIASHVASHTSLSGAAAGAAVDAVFTALTDALAKGETVTITGFGTFATKTRAARAGRNPRTGEPIAIEASTAPSFEAGKTLRDAVN